VRVIDNESDELTEENDVTGIVRGGSKIETGMRWMKMYHIICVHDPFCWNIVDNDMGL